MTKKEKDVIRNSPCGKCGAVPPFENGSRCHTHRIVPGSEGGKYTKENTVPRCPSCHNIEHIETRRTQMRILGLTGIGGKRVNEVHPGHAQRAGRLGGFANGGKGTSRAHELYPNMRYEAGSKGGFSLHARYPGKAHEFGLMGGILGAHRRWHIGRNVVSKDCVLCQGLLPPPQRRVG